MAVAGEDNVGGRVALYLTFLRAALCYWLLVFPRLGLELRRSRNRARAIQDPALRELALDALAQRSNIEGAAAFAVLVPWRRRATTVRALVALQTIYSYADVLAEQPSPNPVETARQVHLALLAALDVSSGRSGSNDVQDVFVDELIAACRLALSRLPSYRRVAARVRRSAEGIVAFQSLSLGSEGELERWSRAAAEGDERLAGLEWWELAAAAGSSLDIYCMIAASACPELEEHEIATLADAYFPAVCALHSLLDSLIDRGEDDLSGELNLVARYPTPQDMADGLEHIAMSARLQVRALPRWRRHTLLVVAMACSYLIEAPRHEPGEPRERVLAVLGPLARPALSVFALRRFAAFGRAPASASNHVLDCDPHRADARVA